MTRVYTPYQAVLATAQFVNEIGIKGVTGGKVVLVSDDILRCTDSTGEHDVEIHIEDRFVPGEDGITAMTANVFVTPHEDGFFESPVDMARFTMEPDGYSVLMGLKDENGVEDEEVVTGVMIAITIALVKTECEWHRMTDDDDSEEE